MSNAFDRRLQVHARARRRRYLTLTGAVALVVIGVAYFSAVDRAGGSHDAATTGSSFERTSTQARQFMDAYSAITLTDAQEAVRVEALSAIPARCCSDYSAATCCCECNLSRTIWGLAKTMIVGGAGAEEVRQAAVTWTETLNPAGYAGDACYTGGCDRPLQTDGCGGMDADELIF
jgi:hypothetical protein